MQRETLHLKRGDDHQFQLTLCWAGGKPFDLINTQRADLHAVVGRQRVLTISTTTGELEFLNRSEGKMLLNIPHKLTEAAEWEEASYDLQLTDNSGKIKTVLEGKIKLSPDITGFHYFSSPL